MKDPAEILELLSKHDHKCYPEGEILWCEKSQEATKEAIKDYATQKALTELERLEYTVLKTAESLEEDVDKALVMYLRLRRLQLANIMGGGE